MIAKTLALSPCCKAGTDDDDDIVLPLGVDNDRDSALNLTDRDESILILRLDAVVDLQVILLGLKELSGLSE